MVSIINLDILERGYITSTSLIVGDRKLIDCRFLCESVSEFQAFYEKYQCDLRTVGLTTFETSTGNFNVWDGTKWNVVLNQNDIQDIQIIKEFYMDDTGSEDSPSLDDNKWVTTHPTWLAGAKLWIRDKIIYKDSTAYTVPVENTDWGALTTLDNRISNIEERKMYRLIIESSNGNIFKNGNIDTTLTAHLYSWDNEITDNIDANRFIWTRISKNPDNDTEWNEKHFSGTKSITITSDDVDVRATFQCTVLDAFGRAMAI